MTGTFELFADETMCFRFALKAPDGTVVAVSRSFPDKQAAMAGISAVREYAGMGLITDLCPEVPAADQQPGPTQKMGTTAVTTAAAAARGEKVEARIDTGTEVVTKDNAQKFTSFQ